MDKKKLKVGFWKACRLGMAIAADLVRAVSDGRITRDEWVNIGNNILDELNISVRIY